MVFWVCLPRHSIHRGVVLTRPPHPSLLLAGLVHQECEAFYNPRQCWSTRAISGVRDFLFTGRALLIHYLNRSWRGGAGTVLADTGVITWN